MAGFDPNIYLGNPNLPSSRAEFEYTPEMIREVQKCSDNISHFAENYFHITTLDHGKQKIQLFRPQKRLLKSLGRYNRVCCLASRQSGKCCSETTYIKIRNKKTGEISTIQIGEFHNSQK